MRRRTGLGDLLLLCASVAGHLPEDDVHGVLRRSANEAAMVPMACFKAVDAVFAAGACRLPQQLLIAIKFRREFSKPA